MSNNVPISNSYAIGSITYEQYNKDTVEYEQYMEMNVEQRKSVKILHCSGRNLTELPPLYDALRVLACDSNELTELPPLPARLLKLDCSLNPLTDLPHLPFGLLDLSYEHIAEFREKPTVPTTLTRLDCPYSLAPANFPDGLLDLQCTFLGYDHLPDNLPDTIRTMNYASAEFNQEGHPVKLPNDLRELNCVESYLPSPSELPSNLERLICTEEHMGDKERSYMERFPNLVIESYGNY